MGILVTAYWLKKATIFQLCPWFVVSYCTWLAINAIMYFHTTKHVVSLMLCLPFWVEFVWRYVPSSVCKQTSKNWNGDNHCLRILHETFVKNFDLSGFVSYFADFFLLHCRIAVLTFESVRICKTEKWWNERRLQNFMLCLPGLHSVPNLELMGREVNARALEGQCVANGHLREGWHRR